MDRFKTIVMVGVSDEEFASIVAPIMDITTLEEFKALTGKQRVALITFYANIVGLLPLGIAKSHFSHMEPALVAMMLMGIKEVFNEVFEETKEGN